MASPQSSPAPHDTSHILPAASSITITGEATDQPGNHSRSYMLLLVINYVCLFVGSVASALLSKFYFNHKGTSRWVSTWVQSVGFPLLLLPVYLPYYFFNCTSRKPFTKFTPKLLLTSTLIGLLLGFNNFLFSWGNSYLPVSTSSLLMSTQLAFTLILCVILVKQKITFHNLNCVILLTSSSILIALNARHGKTAELSRGKYLIGLFSTLGAGLLFSLYLPVMEIIYRQIDCYSMLVELQLIMQVAATVFATVGMAAGGGFVEMKNESSKVFELGAKAYWLTVCFNVVTWQLSFLGTAGLVYLTTSLTGGICMAALLSMNVLGGIVVYGDDFGGVKAVSTALSVWGVCSYVYGLWKIQKKTKRMSMEVEMA